MLEIAQERVHELFDYHPDGHLIYKVSRGKMKAGSIAGAVHRDGYIRVKVDYKLYFIHRLIFLWHHGYLPVEVDHRKSHLDNRIENIRDATRSQNLANRIIHRNNKSGYKGVSKKKKTNLWRAQIAKDRKQIHLGYFDSAEKAHAAYCIAATELFGEFAKAA